MSQIIAVTAGKGGTGKSTTSANVARGFWLSSISD